MRTLLGFGSDLVGAADDAGVPGAAPVASLVKPEPKSMQDRLKGLGVRGGVGLVGGYAGYKLFKGHPIMGVLVGASAGMSAPGLLRKEHRANAVANLASDAGAVVGAKVLKSHPVIGFVLGAVAGGVAGHYAVENDSVKKVLGV